MAIPSLRGRRPKKTLLVIGAGLALIAGVVPAIAAGDTLVSNGSPSSPFPQNKQNEPAIARDPVMGALIAGANDELSQGPCTGTTTPLAEPSEQDSEAAFPSPSTTLMCVVPPAASALRAS